MNCFNYLKIMKKEIFALGLAALFAVQSCAKEGDGKGPDPDGQARITLAINMEEDAATKIPYTAVEPYESAITDVQVLIFDSQGRLNAYKSTKTSDNISITTTFGTKTVWAVVNGPDLKNVKTLTGLTAVSLNLGANSRSGGKGFVMTGSAEVTVDRADVPATIDVRRLTSRVALCNITNNLPVAYANMVVKSILLTNVPGNQNISGTASVSAWYNMAGRENPSDSESIIDGVSYMASCPELTFSRPDKSVANGERLEQTFCFYSYPNASADRKTKLVVTVEIDRETYYYPVVLENLERNKAYTVNMTITALGSKDPDKKVEKGTVTTTVNVLPWGKGAEYTETI